MKTVLLALLLLSPAILAQQPSDSQAPRSWKLSSSKVQRVVVLEGGRFFTQSWTDRTTGRELQGGAQADELGAMVDGKEVTGIGGGWSLVSASQRPAQRWIPANWI